VYFLLPALKLEIRQNLLVIRDFAHQERLDKFWHNQDIVYDFRAQLQGTGSRSEVFYD